MAGRSAQRGGEPSWFWYIARGSEDGQKAELLLDLDSKRELAWSLFLLGRAVRQGFLKARAIVYRSTPGKDRFHVFVFVESPRLSKIEAVLWQSYLGSDQRRQLFNLTRWVRKVPDYNLLIARRDYKVPGREPDYVCHCDVKKHAIVLCPECPVIGTLHGAEAGANYYPVRTERAGRRRIAVRLEKMLSREKLRRL